MEATDGGDSDAGDVPSQALTLPDVRSAAPVTIAASVAPATQTTHVSEPTAQIAPTLVTLARTVNGAQQMTVRLHPADLGMVQVRIERARSGLTQIDITADKPETLLALQRDQPALHRTLDQAGVPSVGRTISFHAVPHAPASPDGGSAGSGNNGGQHAPSSGRASYASADADGSSGGGGRGGHFAREGNRWQSARQQTAGSEENRADAPAAKRTYRAGLDITA